MRTAGPHSECDRAPDRTLRNVRGYAWPVRISRQSGRNDEQGFTLLELIVIMGILGIVVGFAVPLINADRFRMDAAALDVSTALHAAQRKGVLQGNNANIAFDTAGNRFSVHMDANNDGILQGSEEFVSLGLEEGVVFGRGGAPTRPKGASAISFAVASGMPTLRFFRNGSASEEGILYLTSERSIRSGDFPQDTRAIEVERSTGRIRCFSNKSGSWTERC